MGAGRDQPGGRLGRIDRQRRGALHSGGPRIAMSQHEPCHAVGERCLADALRAADQPGMRHPRASIAIKQRALGIVVSEQRGVLAGMQHRHLRLDLTGAHAELTALPVSAANRRSRTVVHIRAATVAASALASISTHRCGSAAAICR